jgi:HAD superfamily hydrolase (TIGR01490 family)
MSGDNPKVRAALFDMDRTLVRKETASLYVRYQHDIGQATTLDLLRAFYWAAQYTMGVLDADKVADKVLQSLRGLSEPVFITQCDDWFTKYVEHHIADKGRHAVARHKARGDVCAIVTGGTRYGAGPLARRLDIEHVVATELEIDEAGQFTGRAVKPLCLGEGKLRRAEAFANKLGFDLHESTFYTDSVSDIPLLERVAEPIVVNPDPRLLRIAKQRGWPIERW